MPPTTRLSTSRVACAARRRVGGTSQPARTGSAPSLTPTSRPLPPLSRRSPSAMPRNTTAAAASFNPGPPPPTEDGKVSVLMVCLGNICRSPSAEAVFRAAVEKRGLSSSFWIDSCGTGGGSGGWYKDGGFSYHEGDPADPRMTKAASARGISLTSRSRPLTPADVERVDYILAMDAANERAIAVAAQHWAEKGRVKDGRGGLGDALPVTRLTSYLRDPALQRAHGASGVPDPYYGGAAGFETVLDLLEDACEGLLDVIMEEKGVA